MFDFYKDIQAAALRTYITAQLSFMILHLHESGDFRNQSIVYREQFRERNANIRDVFKSKLPLANKDVWSCDPSNYDGELDVILIENIRILANLIFHSIA